VPCGDEERQREYQREPGGWVERTARLQHLGAGGGHRADLDILRNRAYWSNRRCRIERLFRTADYGLVRVPSARSPMSYEDGTP